MSLSLENAASAAVGDFVAAYFDGSERGRSFVSSAGAPLNGIANSLPKIASISAVQQQDGSFGGQGGNVTGGYKIQLQFAAVDTINSSSTGFLFLDGDAYIVKASTNNG